jgi:hypothetical protein
MVVLAGAALDATTKRIIRDALQDIVVRVPSSLVEARKFVKRQLLENLSAKGGDYLAEALLSESPRKRVVEFAIEEITGDSLQSVEQLEKASRFLGVNVGAPALKPAFEARNQIIHEMDATLGTAGKKRRQRKRKEMWTFAKVLLGAASELLRKVDEQLSTGVPT